MSDGRFEFTVYFQNRLGCSSKEAVLSKKTEDCHLLQREKKRDVTRLDMRENKEKYSFNPMKDRIRNIMIHAQVVSGYVLPRSVGYQDRPLKFKHVQDGQECRIYLLRRQDYFDE